MAAADLKTLWKKVKTLAHGPHADLLGKLIDMLYERDLRKMEHPMEEEQQTNNIAAVRRRSGAYR